jgi:chromosome segregation ATPase
MYAGELRNQLVKKESQANAMREFLKMAQQSKDEAIMKVGQACLETDKLKFKLTELQWQLAARDSEVDELKRNLKLADAKIAGVELQLKGEERTNRPKWLTVNWS